MNEPDPLSETPREAQTGFDLGPLPTRQGVCSRCGHVGTISGVCSRCGFGARTSKKPTPKGHRTNKGGRRGARRA